MTRFFVVGHEAAKLTGDDKTSVVFTTKDEPGALVSVLQAFKDGGVNMSFIQSRPSKKRNWGVLLLRRPEGSPERRAGGSGDCSGP